jgi:hypothetical protein
VHILVCIQASAESEALKMRRPQTKGKPILLPPLISDPDRLQILHEAAVPLNGIVNVWFDDDDDQSTTAMISNSLWDSLPSSQSRRAARGHRDSKVLTHIRINEGR